MLIHLPDGSVVAAVPQDAKGLARGGSFWGSGSLRLGSAGAVAGHNTAWAEALTTLRAHWPAEQTAASGNAAAAEQPLEQLAVAPAGP